MLVLMLVQGASAEFECFPTGNPYITNCFENKPEVYNTTLPIIAVDFRGQPGVAIGNDFALYNFNGSRQEQIRRINATAYQASYHLPNGKYKFSVSANSTFGLSTRFNVNFSIAGSSMIISVVDPQNRHVRDPNFAFGKNDSFMLDFLLQRPATCRFSTDQTPDPASDLETLYEQYASRPLRSSPDFMHASIPNFNMSIYSTSYPYDGSDEPLFKMIVVCNETTGHRYSFDVIYVGADRTPPSVSTRANPSPIIDGNSPNTTITITSNDRSVCTMSNLNPGDGASYTYVPGYDFQALTDYNRTTTDVLLITDEQYANRMFVFNVTCENLAGLESSASFNLPVALLFTQEVEIASPAAITNMSPVMINARTRLADTCKYRLNSSEQWVTMTRNDGNKNHSATRSLADGRYSLEVDCNQIGVNAVREFIVDRNPPLAPNITAGNSTCSMSRLTADLKGADSAGGSGIREFWYNASVQGDANSTYTITGTTSGRIDKPISRNTQGRTYSIQARSIDNAGNAGPFSSKSVVVTNDSVVECDRTDPDIVVRSNYSNETKKYAIIVDCEDAQSGCAGTFKYSLHNSESDSCSFNLTKNLRDPVDISRTTNVCYAVFDRNNNNATDSHVYKITYPLTCYDGEKNSDESATDCGGKCAACRLNSTCKLNSDCETNFCTSAKVCALSSCSDGRKNGLETGTDCGGPTCNVCSVNATCTQDADCSTRNCVSGKCQPATCSDGKLDGTETDVDCGSTCAKCAAGLRCIADSDCGTGYCNPIGLCAEESTIEKPIDPITPDEAEKNLWGFAFVILGILFVLGGGGMLYYGSQQKSSSGASSQMQQISSEFKGMPKPVIVKQAKEPTKEELQQKEKLKERAVRMKQARRRSILDEFETGEKPRDKKPPQRKDAPKKSEEKKMPEQKQEETKGAEKKTEVVKEEEDVFDKLKRIAQQQPRKKK